MDRKIPQEVIRKERRKKALKWGIISLACIFSISVIIMLLRDSISEKDVQFSTVDKGTIEVSVSASGKVMPAFEEVVITPIESRIIEVYKKAGDSVDVGTPILKLDLQSIETDYHKMLDELQIRQQKMEQMRLKNNSAMSEREMQLKVNDLKIDRMKVEIRNERYLDSIGAGTTDKVREAQLNYNVSRLEQEQARKKYENDKKVNESEWRTQQLDIAIFRKTLAETERILKDAQIRSPRKAVLTYINNQIGARVPQGTQIAILSDLSHFRVDGEIADSYGDRISVGSKVIVKVGKDELSGFVNNLTPLSKNGIIQFSVQLDDDDNKRLRSGLKTDVYVMNAVKEGVLRIANGSYYTGPGTYELFVTEGKSLKKRSIKLGESNYEYVEVISGLNAGEKVVVSDMSSYRNRNKIKISK